ncbi:MAG: hypothetical protein R3E12_02095 [Candidatus Eisenbacteria bacterium]
MPQIKFRRDEFQAYYDENKDRCRGPDEVMLGTLLISDEATAQDLEKLPRGWSRLQLPAESARRIESAAPGAGSRRRLSRTRSRRQFAATAEVGPLRL